MTRERSKFGMELQRQLTSPLDGKQAHASLEDAVKGFPESLYGMIPAGLPSSAWQILEHLRIAQHDILSFSDNAEGKYKKLSWPDEYWPKEAVPPNGTSWDTCLQSIRDDRKAFDKLLEEADDKSLIEVFPWGDGQNLLREALLIADHNAYHTGELIVVRRLLGAWKS